MSQAMHPSLCFFSFTRHHCVVIVATQNSDGKKSPRPACFDFGDWSFEVAQSNKGAYQRLGRAVYVCHVGGIAFCHEAGLLFCYRGGGEGVS